MPHSPPMVESICRKLGGRRVLGQDISSDADLARVVLARIPLAALGAMQKSGFSDGEIDRLVIPSRTRRHRETKKESLTVEESDRLVRLARIQALAEDAFDDREKANKWLRQPLGLLDGRSPLEMAKTEAGGRIIEQLLGKIAWGAAA